MGGGGGGKHEAKKKSPKGGAKQKKKQPSLAFSIRRGSLESMDISLSKITLGL
jgi:hypothetical protein